MANFLKNLFALKLRTKIIFMVVIQILLIMGTTGYIYIKVDLEIIAREQEDQMQQIVKTIASIGVVEFNEDWTYYQEFIDNLYNALDDIVYIAVFNEADTLTAYVINEELVEYEPGAAVTDSLERTSVLNLDRRNINPASLNDLGNVSEDIMINDKYTGIVKMGYSKVNFNNRIDEIIRRNIYMVVIFVVLGAGLSYLLATNFTKPLRKLSDAMETLPQGNTDLLLETKDEYGILTRSFNQMVISLRNNEFFDQFGRDLAKVFTINKIFTTLLGRLHTRFNIQRGAIFIRSKEKNIFQEVHRVNFSLEFPDCFHELLFDELEVHIQKNEISFSLEGLKIIANETPPLRPLVEELEKNNVFWVVYMIRQDKCMGVIYFGKETLAGEVSLEEKKFVVNLVASTLLPIENALLYADLTEQERFKKEIEIAKGVQESLLPQGNPDFDGFDIAGICLPAKEIGGDYFDYVHVDENRIGIVIADVVGKGTSAAFYMAEIKGMVVSLSSIYKSPKELLKVLNASLFSNVDKKVFATMVYGILNKKSKEFIYARAGHNPVLYKSAANGKVDYITPEGIGLGLDRGAIFNKVIVEEKIKLRQNDVLLLYTDGITEAMNPANEEYGEERFKDFIAGQDLSSAGGGSRIILNEIRTFADGCEQNDDITMVVIKVD